MFIEPTVGGPIPEEYHQCESVDEYLTMVEHVFANDIPSSPYTHINPDVPELWLGTKTENEIFVINLEKVRAHYGATSECTNSNLQLEFALALKWGEDVRAATERGRQRKNAPVWN